MTESLYIHSCINTNIYMYETNSTADKNFRNNACRREGTLVLFLVGEQRIPYTLRLSLVLRLRPLGVITGVLR